METKSYDNDLNNLINNENTENHLNENEIKNLKMNLINQEKLKDEDNEERICSEEKLSINQEINNLNNEQENEKEEIKITNINNNNFEDENVKKKNKYEHLSITQIKELIGTRNKKLLQLYDEKKKSKEQLNNILKNLNDLYELSIKNIQNKEKYTLTELKELYEKRKKELKNSNQLKQTLKSQFFINLKKLDSILSPEKIHTFAKEIDIIKKDNNSINQQIQELNSKNLINSIELKICNDNKKFPSKINNYTQDVQSFSNEKHYYYTKLNMNKRSLDNLIKEKNLLNKLYNSIIKEDSDNNIVSYLNFWLKLINQDLEGTEDEILEKIDDNKSKVVNEIDKRRKIKLKLKSNILQLPILTDSSYHEKESRNKINDLNVNKSANFSSQKKPYQGIFNKYSLLKDYNDSNISNSNLKVNKKKSRIVLKNITNLKKEIFQDILKEFSNDYFATSDDDYKELLDKKEQFLDINSRIESKIRENSKNSSEKLNKISRTINDNITRLNYLNQKNELLSNEIINLENLLLLTFHQNEIKKEIKNNESKVMVLNNKKISDLYYNNENILRDLKDDENKKFKLNLNYTLEKKEKKNYIPTNIPHQITKKIKLFNNISKIKKINKENLNDIIREKKIQEIKNKYFPIDNNKISENKRKEEINYDINNYLENETMNINKEKQIYNKIITVIEQKEKNH